jgi:hypothetical protein
MMIANKANQLRISRVFLLELNNVSDLTDKYTVQTLSEQSPKFNYIQSEENHA